MGLFISLLMQITCCHGLRLRRFYLSQKKRKNIISSLLYTIRIYVDQYKNFQNIFACQFMFGPLFSSLMTQTVKNLPKMQETRFDLGWEDFEKGNLQPTPVFMPENLLDRGAWRPPSMDYKESTTEQLIVIYLHYLVYNTILLCIFSPLYDVNYMRARIIACFICRACELSQ